MGIDALVYYRVPPLPAGIEMPDAVRDPHYGCYNFDEPFVREMDAILGDDFEIAHKERIGNYAMCDHLFNLLGSDISLEPLRFIVQASRGCDTIPADRVWIQHRAAEQLLVGIIDDDLLQIRAEGRTTLRGRGAREKSDRDHRLTISP